MRAMAFPVLCLLVLAGCASRLDVVQVSCSEDGNACVNNSVHGLEYYDRQYFVAEKMEQKFTPAKRDPNSPNGNAQGDCARSYSYELITLPGERRMLNFTPSAFAKSEFAVHYDDKGFLKQVSLNSTPAAKDAADALTSVAGATLALGKGLTDRKSVV